MSVYFLLALAFGTMSGGIAAPAPAVQPAAVVSKSRLAAERSVSLAVRRLPSAVNRAVAQRLTANGQQIEAPMTGAASPRAPARA